MLFKSVFAVVMSAVLFSASALPAQRGWGKPFSAKFAGGNSLNVEVTLSFWQLQGMPADPKDPKMDSKRYPENASMSLYVYYAYKDQSGATQYGETQLSGVVDWNSGVVRSTIDLNFTGTVVLTIVPKVPGYNTAEGEAVFINSLDPYANGTKGYVAVVDYTNKRVAPYKG